MTSKHLFLAYAFVCFVSQSRGVFELSIGKIGGYAFQLLSLLVVALAFFSKFALQKPKHIAFIYYYILVILFLFTIITTLFLGQNSLEQAVSVGFVNILNIFFLSTAYYIYSCRRDITVSSIIKNESVINTLILALSMYVSALSLFQFFGFIEFPGSWFIGEVVRLSGPVGSKQHLSILMGVLSLLSLSLYTRHQSKANLFVVVTNCLVLILAFTRIGYFLFGSTLLAYFIRNLQSFRKLFFNKTFIFIGLMAAFYLIFFSGFGDKFSLFLSRIFAIGDLEEGANLNRFESWSRGLELYLESPILISNMLGSASQIPKQVLDLQVSHFESGQVQYLINFGLIFTVIVNLVFVRWGCLSLMSRPVSIVSPLPITLALSLFIYMFNEIVPIFILLPLVAFEQLLTQNHILKSSKGSLKNPYTSAKIGQLPQF